MEGLSAGVVLSGFKPVGLVEGIIEAGEADPVPDPAPGPFKNVGARVIVGYMDSLFDS